MVHVYTGNGKGKTTAALGLALRAAGAGMKVFIGQFAKGMKYSELDSLAIFGEKITVKQFGLNCFIRNQPEEADIKAARDGLSVISTAMSSGEYGLVVADEGNIATYFNLFSIDELIEAINRRAPLVEVVVTGRNADSKLLEMADLVTEMKEIKHYYNKGVQARKGIEK